MNTPNGSKCNKYAFWANESCSVAFWLPFSMAELALERITFCFLKTMERLPLLRQLKVLTM